MKTKMKKIILEDLRKGAFYSSSGSGSRSAAFKVKKIINSIDYKIGDTLTEGAVRVLCSSEKWTVEIIKKS